MLASGTSKGTILLGRLGKIIGAATRSMASNLKVSESIQDNIDLSRFELQVEDDVAYVEYELSGNNTYHLVESLVPEEYSGRGVGKVLARKTFDHIISHNGRMKLSCDFLVHFYNQNRDEYKKHVVGS